MKHDTSWLLSEVAVWASEGLIDEAQASALRARYPVVNSSSWGQTLITAIGAMIFGFGIILFFAYNWSEMSKASKLALVFGALAISHFTALLLSWKRPDQVALIEGLHMLGTMMFGASIFLIAQIYHIDEHYPNAFLVWGLAALALAWLLPSTIQGGLAVVLLTGWGLAETLAFDSIHLSGVLLVVAGCLSLAWVQRSRELLAAALPASLVLVMANVGHVEADLIFPLVFCCAVLLISLAPFTVYSRFPQSNTVLIGVGSIAYVLQLFFLRAIGDLGGLNNEFSDSVFQAVLTLAFIVTALVCLVALGKQWFNSGSRYFQFHLLLILIGVVVMGAYYFSVLQSVFSSFRVYMEVIDIIISVILALHAVLLIIQGTDTVRWMPVTLGCLMLVVIVLRFNDLFHSMLIRALIFSLLGAGLFLIGHLYSRSKTRLAKAHA
ncbi:MAG: DUF2157 domain-containing protein [Granulosicoccus sp.]